MHPCNIPFHTNQPETLLTRKQVEELLDVSRATIYRWLRSNTAFPKQIRLNPHKKKGAVRWRLSEILAYLAANPSMPKAAKPTDQHTLEPEVQQ